MAQTRNQIETNIKFDGGFEPWLISATKLTIKANIKFDGGFEPWLMSATKIRIKTIVKFDGGFKPWLIPAAKIKTNNTFENLPNFGVFNFRIVLQVQDDSSMEQPSPTSNLSSGCPLKWIC